MNDKSFLKLVKIMGILRSKDGCPWDKAQTHSSLKKHLIEEAYEVCHAIDSKDAERLKDELGDFLFQVIFHAQIAKERGVFDITDVIRASCEKMLRRHPHVFGKHKAKNAQDAYSRWQEKKELENFHKGKKSLLNGVPAALPALLKAQKISRRAAASGFEWPDLAFVIDKVHEELEEVKEEIKNKNKARLTEEIGDLLFAITILARFNDIDAEDALHRATRKFARRFGRIETACGKKNKKIKECGFEELYRLWRAARR